MNEEEEEWESFFLYSKLSAKSSETNVTHSELEKIDSDNKNILLLGMVYDSSRKLIPSRGQQYRDQIRIKGLVKSGYEVYTIDNKHSNTINTDNRHCCTDFTGSKRMFEDLMKQWPEIQFDHIILDYFFSPVLRFFIL